MIPPHPVTLSFSIGRLSATKGFVHVIDDFSLDILLTTLDTAMDLALYLERRAAFIESGHLTFATGEEDLLAHYLRHSDNEGIHYFYVPPGTSGIGIGEGSWQTFQVHPDRLAQIEANRISYSWDRLIEEFTKHQLEGTQYDR